MLLLPHDSRVETRYTVTSIRASTGDIHLPDDLRVVGLSHLIDLASRDSGGCATGEFDMAVLAAIQYLYIAPPKRIETGQVLPC